MKRLIIVLFYLVITLGLKAQIARWLIPPLYEKIQLVDGVDAIMTEADGIKTIWTMDGQKLITTPDDIYPFQEGIALCVKPGTSTISTAYKQNGESLDFKGANVAHAYPFFSSGKLLIMHGDYYRYVDASGRVGEKQYTEAFPYFNGYAVCDTYLNFEKQKDICHFLLDDKDCIVNFSFQEKEFDSDDLQFISSINDENIGVVVIKQRVYLFNGQDRKLSPVFINDNPSQSLKEQAKLTSDIEQCYVQNSDSTYTLTAKCGKSGFVAIVFDLMRRPKSIIRNETEYFFKMKEKTKKVLESPLKAYKEDKVWGLSWDEAGEMLPPQFDNIIACFSNKALVQLNGKAGMLELFKDESFKLKMNKGDDIAFRHQKIETSIRADFPTFLSSNNVSIEIDPRTGCDIDKTSKENKNTESGNYVQYNCVLNIPSNLPDELTTIEYPVTVHYDGLKSSQIPFKVNAWHYKYFVVDVDDSQTALENGTVSFVFNINAERIASDGVYPTIVQILTDSLQYEYEKMSEIRHKCKVFSLKEGINNITIQVLEQGCPPAAFPFEVEYHKPVEKTKNKPAEKEKVTIKKKENKPSVVKKETTQPRVIM